jgi:hypothetical protein
MDPSDDEVMRCVPLTWEIASAAGVRLWAATIAVLLTAALTACIAAAAVRYGYDGLYLMLSNTSSTPPTSHARLDEIAVSILRFGGGCAVAAAVVWAVAPWRRPHS